MVFIFPYATVFRHGSLIIIDKRANHTGPFLRQPTTQELLLLAVTHYPQETYGKTYRDKVDAQFGCFICR